MSLLKLTNKKFKMNKLNIATFWIIVTGLSAVGLAWMQNLAMTTSNTELAASANIFLILFFISVITEIIVFMFYKHKFWGGNVKGSSLGVSFIMFYLFGGIWFLITHFSGMFVLGQSVLLSQVSTRLTEFQNIFFIVFMAPTIEENFFRLALPVLLFMAAKSIFVSFGIKENRIATILQFLVALGGSTLAFAFFHTGQLGNTAFFIQAIIFGAILSFVFLSDVFFDQFESITIVPAALVGVHMANNMAYFGILKTITILLGHPLGILIIIFMGIGFLAAILQLGRLIGVKK